MHHRTDQFRRSLRIGLQLSDGLLENNEELVPVCGVFVQASAHVFEILSALQQFRDGRAFDLGPQLSW